MGLFGPSKQDRRMALIQAKLETEGFSDLFATISKSCFTRCLNDDLNNNLNLAEKKCLDGCTVKYLDTVQVITKYFTTHGQELMMKQQEIQQSRLQ